MINVVTADVMASNGVIHVIDKVILPLPTPPTTAMPTGLNFCLLPNAVGRKSEIQQLNIVLCGSDEICQPINYEAFLG